MRRKGGIGTYRDFGFFATNITMKNDVKPAMRALNIATNLGIGAYALKEALGK